MWPNHSGKFFLTCCFVFRDKASQCRPVWPQTCNPDSAPQVLELQAHATVVVQFTHYITTYATKYL